MARLFCAHCGNVLLSKQERKEGTCLRCAVRSLGEEIVKVLRVDKLAGWLNECLRRRSK